MTQKNTAWGVETTWAETSSHTAKNIHMLKSKQMPAKAGSMFMVKNGEVDVVAEGRSHIYKTHSTFHTDHADTVILAVRDTELLTIEPK